jgi:hypothetical protein
MVFQKTGCNVQSIRELGAANNIRACLLITECPARDPARAEPRDVVGKLLPESGACVSHLRQRIWIPVDLSRDCGYIRMFHQFQSGY